MLPLYKHRANWVGLAIALVGAILFVSACRNRSELTVDQSEPLPASEPQQYSATVVRTVEDELQREITTTRVARSGEKWREQWQEENEARALIWQPDLQKSFLLFLDRRTYIESAIGGEQKPTDFSPGSRDQAATAELESFASADPARDQRSEPDAIERALDHALQPAQTQARALPDESIDDHPCAVFEQRASFSDGRVEIIKTFRARDLAGLALRIEAETIEQNRRVKITTERRDVRLEVSPDEFIIPSGFKKLENPPPR